MLYKVTKQSKVVPLIRAFFENYPKYSGGPFYTRERYNRMLTLDPETCTVAQFEEALGVTHWTANCCDECKEDFDTLLHVGQEVDYDARWLLLCKGCLLKAADML